MNLTCLILGLSEGFFDKQEFMITSFIGLHGLMHQVIFDANYLERECLTRNKWIFFLYL